jgi:hypothetical protein
MSQIYIWQFINKSPEAACEQFAGALKKHTEFYNEHLSTNCNFRYTQIGNILVGQVSCDLGIANWEPWLQKDSYGIAWSGICEDYLGVSDYRSLLYDLQRDVIETPIKLTDLTGSFSVCAWESAKGQVAVATGATQHQTLWKTSGPYGWALGSRQRLALELVGHKLELDEIGASIFLGYGYLLGESALFKNLSRISNRKHILLKQNDLPKMSTYQSLGDYLEHPRVSNFKEAVQLCANRIEKRVTRQLRFSQNPQIYLSGGRDSRCVSAALSRAGFIGEAVSFGTSSSVDVKIATKVVKTLGFRQTILNVDRLALLAASRHRAQLWTKISEGIETIRHGLYYDKFFSNNLPFPTSLTQTFIGLHGGLQKPIISYFHPPKVNMHIGSHLKFKNEILEKFEYMRHQVNMKLKKLNMSASRWPELYHWQEKLLKWGQDNMLVKDLFNWWWTPLYDKKVIQIGWHLPKSYQSSTRFVEAITIQLSDQLKGIAYDHPNTSRVGCNFIKKNISRGSRKLQSLFEMILNRSLDRTPMRQAFWEDILFKQSDTTWKEWIDESFILKLIQQKRNEEILWNTATVQLFKEAHFAV